MLANGVRREFKIAKAIGLLLIPVGATGYTAQVLWQEIIDNFESYYPTHSELKGLFAVLGDASGSKRLIDTVIDIINKAKGRSLRSSCLCAGLFILADCAAHLGNHFFRDVG